MTKNKMFGIVILILVFVLSIFFLFIIPGEYTTAIWITLAFDIIAFGSQLFLWYTLFKGQNSKEDVFYKTPAVTMSTLYMVIQFIICLVMAFAGNIISSKTAIIVNFVVCVLMWVVIIMLITVKDHVKKVNSRQKDHHIKL